MTCRHGGPRYVLTLTEVSPDGTLSAVSIDVCARCRNIVDWTINEAIRRVRDQPTGSGRQQSSAGVRGEKA